MSRQTADSNQVVADDDRSGQRDTPNAEVVVKGRNVEVPDHYRVYVSQKLARSERLDPSIFHFDVELDHERNRRQRKACQRVEITARGRGPVVRAEARADSFYGAFESAIAKLESRLRRDKGRRTVSYGDKTPLSVAEATALVPLPEQGPKAWDRRVVDTIVEPDHDGHDLGADTPGQIVRIKEHRADPMSVDDALYEMELVGHDFFLFHDKETGRPSVVYRRHAYDYGLIRLT
ncbi:ribosome-associated translation inhibitor RaiA [Mycolicibacillus parakoreensis]|uniref:Ribosome hibernation promoting factor n=1 Tax=Mycolicibacillus parakoreensis TaxID=1069221 RepID=A0ABY3TZX6_9MYCO|nr:ribosome-associated translation inhibitor RaiA [Mycolicibacillus parakoreensis]MCV7315609.1 ribosome-associated translation inhibitor RaiA [Mycolicibacillus parakoreensis]ULN51951.1 ribosome-associated translation inhibitor RaiA [Mycolicibacillus parakoreensis]